VTSINLFAEQQPTSTAFNFFKNGCDRRDSYDSDRCDSKITTPKAAQPSQTKGIFDVLLDPENKSNTGGSFFSNKVNSGLPSFFGGSNPPAPSIFDKVKQDEDEEAVEVDENGEEVEEDEEGATATKPEPEIDPSTVVITYNYPPAAPSLYTGKVINFLGPLPSTPMGAGSLSIVLQSDSSKTTNEAASGLKVLVFRAGASRKILYSGIIVPGKSRWGPGKREGLRWVEVLGKGVGFEQTNLPPETTSMQSISSKQQIPGTDPSKVKVRLLKIIFETNTLASEFDEVMKTIVGTQMTVDTQN